MDHFSARFQFLFFASVFPEALCEGFHFDLLPNIVWRTHVEILCLSLQIELFWTSVTFMPKKSIILCSIWQTKLSEIIENCDSPISTRSRSF